MKTHILNMLHMLKFNWICNYYFCANL